MKTIQLSDYQDLETRLKALESQMKNQLPRRARLSIIVFSNDMDRVFTALNIGVAAAASGLEVQYLFNFWGVCALRNPNAAKTKKSFLEWMFAMMLPSGLNRLALSRLHMGGMGKFFFNLIMAQKHVVTMKELLEQFKDLGIKVYACEMTMGILGISEQELIQGVGVVPCGIAQFLQESSEGVSTLFI